MADVEYAAECQADGCPDACDVPRSMLGCGSCCGCLGGCRIAWENRQPAAEPEAAAWTPAVCDPTAPCLTPEIPAPAAPPALNSHTRICAVCALPARYHYLYTAPDGARLAFCDGHHPANVLRCVGIHPLHRHLLTWVTPTARAGTSTQETDRG